MRYGGFRLPPPGVEGAALRYTRRYAAREYGWLVWARLKRRIERRRR